MLIKQIYYTVIKHYIFARINNYYFINVPSTGFLYYIVWRLDDDSFIVEYEKKTFNEKKLCNVKFYSKNKNFKTYGVAKKFTIKKKIVQNFFSSYDCNIRFVDEYISDDDSDCILHVELIKILLKYKIFTF